MGRLLAGLVLSLIALAAFSVILYDVPVIAGLGPIVGSAVTIAVLIGWLWARGRIEARG